MTTQVADNAGAAALDVGSLEAAARTALRLNGAGGEVLWDRARRLVGLVGTLSMQPEMAERRFDRRAVEAAALFFEAARAQAVRDGKLTREAVLDDLLTDPAREASIDALLAAAPGRLSDGTRDAAATAIRQHAWRSGASAEAVLLTEAANLDDLGPLWLWRQARRGDGTHETLAAIAKHWRRQSEYGYWETRISELLRFAWSKQVARRRIAAIQVFLEALQDHVGGEP